MAALKQRWDFPDHGMSRVPGTVQDSGIIRGKRARTDTKRPSGHLKPSNFQAATQSRLFEYQARLVSRDCPELAGEGASCAIEEETNQEQRTALLCLVSIWDLRTQWGVFSGWLWDEYQKWIMSWVIAASTVAAAWGHWHSVILRENPALSSTETNWKQPSVARLSRLSSFQSPKD